MTHELKIYPEYFEDVRDRIKNFELRKNDRDFMIGDSIRLREYDPVLMQYTGRNCRKLIRYILKGGQFGIDKDYVILGL